MLVTPELYIRGVFDDKQKFSYFSLKPYVVSPHLNRLVETVQIRGNNICFMESSQKLSLIIIKYTLISRALYNRVLNNHAQILCITLAKNSSNFIINVLPWSSFFLLTRKQIDLDLIH